jgi:hypothetical protein
MIAPELSKDILNPKRRVGKTQLFAHMDNSMCHDGREIREYFARKTMMRVPHTVHASDLSPCAFWLFGYAKERMKNQITSDDGLENTLTEVWEIVNGDLLESVFSKWISRSVSVTKHEGEHHINLH